MYNDRPFEILMPTYSAETFKIYNVLSSILNYPYINPDPKFQYDSALGKLYATSFALIYSEYLGRFFFYQPSVDKSELILQMKFEEEATEIYKLVRELDLYDEVVSIDDVVLNKSFNDLVHSLVSHYQNKIEQDFILIFPTNPSEINDRLFKSIFSFRPELLKLV